MLTFYREHTRGAQPGVAFNICGLAGAAGPGAEPAAAVRLTVPGSTRNGNLVAEFRFDDELYGIRAECPSCVACSACGDLKQAQEEIAASIGLNRALLAGGIVTACLRTVLDALPDPAFVLSVEGVVAWRNAAANASEWAGAFAGTPGKAFALKDSAAQAAFRTALSEAGQEAGGSAKFVNAVHARNGAPALAILKAIIPSLPFKSPWVRLFQGAPEIVAVLRARNSKPTLSRGALRRLYNLTGKEAELAVALTQGETLRAYASRTGVALETARWHSKRLMQKMACRSQQEILHTLLYTNTLFSITG
jgi:DNA-binding CsgD family transcriptional regulator